MAKAASGSERQADVSNTQGHFQSSFPWLLWYPQDSEPRIPESCINEDLKVRADLRPCVSQSLQYLLGPHSVPLKGGTQRGRVESCITMNDSQHTVMESLSTLQCARRSCKREILLPESHWWWFKLYPMVCSKAVSRGTAQICGGVFCFSQPTLRDKLSVLVGPRMWDALSNSRHGPVLNVCQVTTVKWRARSNITSVCVEPVL